MLELNFEGATSEKAFATSETIAENITRYLYTPTPKRMFALALAMRCGIAVEEIAHITGIDPWFLQRIRHIVDIEQALRIETDLPAQRLLALKRAGMSDKRIGELVGKSGLEIRALRKTLGVTPSVFQIDTLAAEFPSETNYLYMTYNGQHHDVAPLGDEGVIILGSGPYRIGSSVEFDWTSVSAVEALRKHHKRSIVVNCNPETVSTDYDTSDRLYFEELTFERIADICEFESPYGVIVSVGGQTPNNRAKALHNYGIPLLGTTVTKFFEKVKEIELDAVAQRGEIKAFVISEHIENAGVHSGDATIVLPPQNINAETQSKIEAVGRSIAEALEITGPF